MSSDAVQRIAALAATLLAQQQEVATLEDMLSHAKERARTLAEVDLPELMRECDLTMVKLADGTKVEVVDGVQCGITADNRAAAHAWLERHGFGGLIKTAVVVAYGRNEHDAALALAERLHAQLGADVELQETVHPSTLKSFVKEQRAAGANVPEDLFSVHAFSTTKFTLPPKRRS